MVHWRLVLVLLVVVAFSGTQVVQSPVPDSPVYWRASICHDGPVEGDVRLGLLDYQGARDFEILREDAETLFGVELVGLEELESFERAVAGNRSILVLTSSPIYTTSFLGEEYHRVNGLACGSAYALANPSTGACHWATALHEIGHLAGYNHSAPLPMGDSWEWECIAEPFDPCEEGGWWHRQVEWRLESGRNYGGWYEHCPHLAERLIEKWGETDIYGRSWT